MGATASSNREVASRTGESSRTSSGRSTSEKNTVHAILFGARNSGKVELFRQASCESGRYPPRELMKSLKPRLHWHVTNWMKQLCSLVPADIIPTLQYLNRELCPKFASITLPSDPDWDTFSMVDTVFTNIVQLWSDPIIVDIYHKRPLYQTDSIPDAAEHFFNIALELCKPYYHPTTDDFWYFWPILSHDMPLEWKLKISQNFRVVDYGEQPTQEDMKALSQSLANNNDPYSPILVFTVSLLHYDTLPSFSHLLAGNPSTAPVAGCPSSVPITGCPSSSSLSSPALSSPSSSSLTSRPSISAITTPTPTNEISTSSTFRSPIVGHTQLDVALHLWSKLLHSRQFRDRGCMLIFTHYEEFKAKILSQLNDTAKQTGLGPFSSYFPAYKGASHDPKAIVKWLSSHFLAQSKHSNQSCVVMCPKRSDDNVSNLFDSKYRDLYTDMCVKHIGLPGDMDAL